ncbi:MAG: succinylglutamate desuccinylase/aspartoacylase family protein [Haliscomenobacter sp.]|nr:succinylglutamate desuccinylase/aspartoacylase family protein [Haliscomenobacter sp.]
MAKSVRFPKKPIRIYNTWIDPGENTMVRIPVGRFPSGNQILIKAHVFRSHKPGPRVLVLGGVHGDEINGIEIIRRTVESDVFSRIRKGMVIAVPVLNVYGFILSSRDVPDGKDINRSFPGSARGSLAARIAATLTKEIFPHIDCGIDLHTGGRGHFNYPQVRFTPNDAPGIELAKAFGAPYLIASKPISKSLRKTALDAGKPILVYEGGENSRLDGYSVEKGIDGIQRVLSFLGMLDLAFEEPNSQVFMKSTRQRAPRAGIFQWTKSSGQKVVKGEPIGMITDPYGMEKSIIKASCSGYIIGHTNVSIVSQGDALFHIAH